MDLGDYSLVLSEKFSEDSVAKHDLYLSIAQTAKKIRILWIIIINLLAIVTLFSLRYHMALQSDIKAKIFRSSSHAEGY